MYFILCRTRRRLNCRQNESLFHAGDCIVQQIARCLYRAHEKRQTTVGSFNTSARPPARSDGTIVSNRVDSIESTSTIRRQIEVVVFDSSIHSPRLAAVGAYYSTCPEDILE